MISWIGVLGKMVGFMATKLAGKKVDLLIDDRRKAARSFMKLYQSMVNLLDISNHLINELAPIKENERGLIQRYHLYFVSRAIDANSWIFLDSVRGLGAAIEMYDPVLAAELVQLSDYKASFLLTASKSFRVIEDLDGLEPEFIVLTSPAKRFFEMDLETFYEHLSTRKGQLYDPSKKLEWPENFLMGFCIDDGDTRTQVITLNDRPGILQMLATLEEHTAVLASGTEHLREFITKHYKPEEIVYLPG